MEIKFNELRNKISSEDIKNILIKYDAPVYKETDKYIIFPTVCHNIVGGSNKLYYYKDSKLFKCYTQCEGTFDIFQLLIKIYLLRGKEINIFESISLCGLEGSFLNEDRTRTAVEEDINYLYNLLHTSNNENINLPKLSNSILDRFIFDKDILKMWQDENISFETMKKYGIKYDPINNCIIIPNYDIDGNLISIRGRFLGEDAEKLGKYRPIFYENKVLSHPSSLSLYGIYQNKIDIKSQKKAIIFEGEKSVMKIDSYYKNNISVATLGKNISAQQIKTLSSLGVQEIILAYDADYTDYYSMDFKRKKYVEIAKSLKTFFNVCILMDLGTNLLGYKDSPIDKGKDVFEKIYKNRIYI